MNCEVDSWEFQPLGAKVNSVNTQRKHSMPLSSSGSDWSIIPSSGKAVNQRLSLLTRSRNWHGRLRILQARQNWSISIGGGRNYVRSICLTCRPTGRRCTGRLKMR